MILKILKLHSPKGSCNFENFQNNSYLLIMNCTQGRAISYTKSMLQQCSHVTKKVLPKALHYLNIYKQCKSTDLVIGEKLKQKKLFLKFSKKEWTAKWEERYGGHSSLVILQFWNIIIVITLVLSSIIFFFLSFLLLNYFMVKGPQPTSTSWAEEVAMYIL